MTWFIFGDGLVNWYFLSYIQNIHSRSHGTLWEYNMTPCGQTQGRRGIGNIWYFKLSLYRTCIPQWRVDWGVHLVQCYYGIILGGEIGIHG